ncbi:MAG: hypothetical protein ABSH20_01895 [Tepidisphaeraceae bacterium]|jgi:hypothetical protein
MKTHVKPRPFDRLSTVEKEAAYEESEHVGSEEGMLLTPDDLREHREAGLRLGRPRVGLGAGEDPRAPRRKTH